MSCPAPPVQRVIALLAIARERGAVRRGGLLFEEGRQVCGRAPWPHEVSANGKILERFLSYAEAQGPIPQERAGEARFAHTTRETSIPVGVV